MVGYNGHQEESSRNLQEAKTNWTKKSRKYKLFTQTELKI